MTNERIVLQISNMTKQFPGVKALDRMQLTLHAGEVMAIAGENGAGKSTLMKILSGVYRPDEGEILLDGEKAFFATPAEAQKAGICTVHQELSVFPLLSIAENIFVGKTPRTKSGTLDNKTQAEETRKILEKFEMSHLAPETIVGNLDIARQQVVEILRATSFDPKILILDEPTSALTLQDTKMLFKIIRKLKENGTSILYISHRLEEIFEICDSVTVMRDGAFVLQKPVTEITQDGIVRAMVGRDVAYDYGRNTSEIGEPILHVEGLCSGNTVRNVSFTLSRGEVLGLGGLDGSGRTELMETLFGLRKMTAGSILVDGKQVKIASPQAAKRHKMAYITKDRKKVGLFIGMSIERNILSGNFPIFSKRGLVLHKKLHAEADVSVERFDIKTVSAKKTVRTLSGGNQQKVMLAMWLLADPEIILVDEPTRGIDVGTKEAIHRILRNLAKQGKAVLMISSDMPELLSASDRILVMSNGEVSGELTGDDRTEYNVMTLAVEKLQTQPQGK